MPSKEIGGDGVGSNNTSKALTEYEVSSLPPRPPSGQPLGSLVLGLSKVLL